MTYTYNMKVTYFITDWRGHVKIGATEDIHTRIKTLQCGNPNELGCIGVCDFEEVYLHGLFKSDHIRGEWFELSEHILRFIANICTLMPEAPKRPIIKPEGRDNYVREEDLATTMFRWKYC